MSSWRCHNCGLDNFAGTENCRQCQASAISNSSTNHYGQENAQANRPPQQGDWQAIHSESSQYPQTSTDNFTQSHQNMSGSDYQQNPHLQAQSYSQDGNNSSPGDYSNPNPYSHPPDYQQNSGYQQSSGYAYNQGDTNNPNHPSQPYAGYQQTDYSRAPSYGAPAVGGYQQSYQGGYGAQEAGIWQEGKKLVMHKQAQLPDRCVKCNAPTHEVYILRKLSWMHQGWFALVLLGLLGWIIFAILSLTIRKKATVNIGICEQHLSKRKTMITIGWAVAILGVLTFIMAIAGEAVWALFLGIVMFLTGVIIAGMATAIVAVAKMDDNYIWLTRVNQDYLANFPPTGRS